MSNKSQAEKDYAKYENAEHTNMEDLGKGVVDLEDQTFKKLYHGRSSDQSQEDFMDELAHNIKLVVAFMDRYQILQGTDKVMSEQELAVFFVKRGRKRLAKTKKFTSKTAEEACKPLTENLRYRGYWPTEVDPSGVKMPTKVEVCTVPIKLVLPKLE